MHEVYKKFTPLTVAIKGKISYRPEPLFALCCKHIYFFSVLKLGILTQGAYGIDSLLEPVSSDQSMNCSLSHFRVGFKSLEGRRLVLICRHFQEVTRQVSELIIYSSDSFKITGLFRNVFMNELLNLSLNLFVQKLNHTGMKYVATISESFNHSFS